jgi:hypothetical protein
MNPTNTRARLVTLSVVLHERPKIKRIHLTLHIDWTRRRVGRSWRREECSCCDGKVAPLVRLHWSLLAGAEACGGRRQRSISVMASKSSTFSPTVSSFSTMGVPFFSQYLAGDAASLCCGSFSSLQLLSSRYSGVSPFSGGGPCYTRCSVRVRERHFSHDIRCHGGALLPHQLKAAGIGANSAA